ncbi:MAG: hypothetical protein II957_03755, partial [Treponema sp.]|nr:hypothetical protein [Treponema sp.]
GKKENKQYNGIWVADADWLQYSIQIEISRKDKVSVTYFNNSLYVYENNESNMQKSKAHQ